MSENRIKIDTSNIKSKDLQDVAATSTYSCVTAPSVNDAIKAVGYEPIGDDILAEKRFMTKNYDLVEN